MSNFRCSDFWHGHRISKSNRSVNLCREAAPRCQDSLFIRTPSSGRVRYAGIPIMSVGDVTTLEAMTSPVSNQKVDDLKAVDTNVNTSAHSSLSESEYEDCDEYETAAQDSTDAHQPQLNYEESQISRGDSGGPHPRDAHHPDLTTARAAQCMQDPYPRGVSRHRDIMTPLWKADQFPSDSGPEKDSHGYRFARTPKYSHIMRAHSSRSVGHISEESTKTSYVQDEFTLSSDEKHTQTYSGEKDTFYPEKTLLVSNTTTSADNNFDSLDQQRLNFNNNETNDATAPYQPGEFEVHQRRVLRKPNKFLTYIPPEKYKPYPPLANLPYFLRPSFPQPWGVLPSLYSKSVEKDTKRVCCPPLNVSSASDTMRYASHRAVKHYSTCARKVTNTLEWL